MFSIDVRKLFLFILLFKYGINFYFYVLISQQFYIFCFFVGSGEGCYDVYGSCWMDMVELVFWIVDEGDFFGNIGGNVVVVSSGFFYDELFVGEK